MTGSPPAKRRPTPGQERLPVALPVASSTNGAHRPADAAPARLRAGNTRRASVQLNASERTGRHGLLRVRDSLSERDRAVLHSVAEHRFLQTWHLRGLHFTGHATPTSATRTCNRVLRRLAQLRVIRTLERPIGGVRAGSDAYVWALGPIGDRLLRLESGTGVRKRMREPSEWTLLHTLAIADAHLALVGAARAGRLELLCVQTEPDCWRRYLGASGEPHTLQPDLFAVTATGGYEDFWFIEVDRGFQNQTTLLAKCRTYQTYRDTGREQHEAGVFPRVVWVMATARRVAALQASIRAARQLDADLFRVTVLDGLADLVAGGAA